MLYSQLHADDACLKITTTSSSDGILYVQLRIDPDSEETAVVKKVAHFVVAEDHQRFSGTEMRLSVPCLDDAVDVESAAEALTLYFQSLRYTAPPFVGVQFNFDVGVSVEFQHREEPIDRFAADLGASADDVLYAVHDEGCVSISCIALMLGDIAPGGLSDIKICLLRYANHAPLINGEDFFLCGSTKGVSSWKVWKKYGLRCKRESSRLANQLVATPLRAPNRQEAEDANEPARLVLAIDICASNATSANGLKYGSLKKSTLDSCYAGGVQTCCRAILQQLADAGRLCTPQQHQDQDLVENFAPLIAKSLAAIVKQSQVGQPVDIEPPQCEASPPDHFNEELILRELQAVLRH
jgi:DNA topoisomerase VI subunit B